MSRPVPDFPKWYSEKYDRNSISRDSRKKDMVTKVTPISNYEIDQSSEDEVRKNRNNKFAEGLKNNRYQYFQGIRGDGFCGLNAAIAGIVFRCVGNREMLQRFKDKISEILGNNFVETVRSDYVANKIVTASDEALKTLDGFAAESYDQAMQLLNETKLVENITALLANDEFFDLTIKKTFEGIIDFYRADHNYNDEQTLICDQNQIKVRKFLDYLVEKEIDVRSSDFRNNPNYPKIENDTKGLETQGLETHIGSLTQISELVRYRAGEITGVNALDQQVIIDLVKEILPEGLGFSIIEDRADAKIDEAKQDTIYLIGGNHGHFDLLHNDEKLIRTIENFLETDEAIEAREKEAEDCFREAQKIEVSQNTLQSEYEIRVEIKQKKLADRVKNLKENFPVKTTTEIEQLIAESKNLPQNEELKELQQRITNFTESISEMEEKIAQDSLKILEAEKKRLEESDKVRLVYQELEQALLDKSEDQEEKRKLLREALLGLDQATESIEKALETLEVKINDSEKTLDEADDIDDLIHSIKTSISKSRELTEKANTLSTKWQTLSKKFEEEALQAEEQKTQRAEEKKQYKKYLAKVRDGVNNDIEDLQYIEDSQLKADGQEIIAELEAAIIELDEFLDNPETNKEEGQCPPNLRHFLPSKFDVKSAEVLSSV